MNSIDGLIGLRRARAALDLGRPGEALDLVGTVIAADPDNADALLVAAEAHRRLGDAHRQSEAASAALRLRPSDPEGLVQAGMAADACGRHDEAVARLREAVALEPHAWHTHGLLATVLAGRRRTRAEAWDHALRAVDLAPDVAAAHSVVGGVALARSDHATAEQAFRTALELDPQDAEAHNNLSLVLARSGRARQAAHGLGSALAIDPQQGEARSNLDWLVVRTIQRVHLTLFVGLFVAVRAVDHGVAGRVVASLVSAAAVGMAVWTVWSNHHGVPRSVLTYLRSFPRREPVRALWGGCCLGAMAGLVLGIVLPPGPALVALVFGFTVLLLGCLLSWSALGLDKIAARRAG